VPRPYKALGMEYDCSFPDGYFEKLYEVNPESSEYSDLTGDVYEHMRASRNFSDLDAIQVVRMLNNENVSDAEEAVTEGLS